jgi:chemotaxis-related protein WspB
MLFLLFQLGPDRYALESSRVVEVLPLVELKRLPQAPRGVAGVFNYRGRPVPAVDLSDLTLGQPSAVRMSTRIIVVRYRSASRSNHLLGLVAENATETIRRDGKDFVDPGVKIGAAPYLGPILMDSHSRPIQWLREEHLLSEPVEKLLFRPAVLLQNPNRSQPAMGDGELATCVQQNAEKGDGPVQA